MFKKDYYRLEDLQGRFSITEADVLYMLEQRLVKACFYVSRSHFIIGGWRQKDFIGYAHVNYQGLVVMPEHETEKLLVAREVTPINYYLMNSGNIALVSTAYGLELETPNNYIHAWVPTLPEKVSWDLVPAKLGAFVTETFWHSLHNSLELFFKNKKGLPDASAFSKQHKSLPTKELTAFFKTFVFSDICIRHDDLVLSNLIPDSLMQVPSVETLPVTTALSELNGNAFDKLIARILMTDRTLSAKPIFRLLAHESTLEEDSRVFDIENVLLDHVDGVIIWKDVLSKSPEKHCSLSTLANKLSNVRKGLGREKANLSQ